MSEVVYCLNCDEYIYHEPVTEDHRRVSAFRRSLLSYRSEIVRAVSAYRRWVRMPHPLPQSRIVNSYKLLPGIDVKRLTASIISASDANDVEVSLDSNESATKGFDYVKFVEDSSLADEDIATSVVAKFMALADSIIAPECPLCRKPCAIAGDDAPIDETFYRPGVSSCDESGNLSIHTKWWDDSGISSGETCLRPCDSDYAFWMWMTQHAADQGAINERDVPKWRAKFDDEQ